MKMTFKNVKMTSINDGTDRITVTLTDEDATLDVYNALRSLVGEEVNVTFGQ